MVRAETGTVKGNGLGERRRPVSLPPVLLFAGVRTEEHQRPVRKDRESWEIESRRNLTQKGDDLNGNSSAWNRARSRLRG